MLPHLAKQTRRVAVAGAETKAGGRKRVTFTSMSAFQPGADQNYRSVLRESPVKSAGSGGWSTEYERRSSGPARRWSPMYGIV